MTDSGNLNVTSVTPSQLKQAGDLFASFAECARGVMASLNGGLAPVALRCACDATGREYWGKLSQAVGSLAEAVNSAADFLDGTGAFSNKTGVLFQQSEQVNSENVSLLHHR